MCRDRRRALRSVTCRIWKSRSRRSREENRNPRLGPDTPRHSGAARRRRRGRHRLHRGRRVDLGAARRRGRARREQELLTRAIVNHGEWSLRRLARPRAVGHRGRAPPTSTSRRLRSSHGLRTWLSAAARPPACGGLQFRRRDRLLPGGQRPLRARLTAAAVPSLDAIVDYVRGRDRPCRRRPRRSPGDDPRDSRARPAAGVPAGHRRPALRRRLAMPVDAAPARPRCRADRHVGAH